MKEHPINDLLDISLENITKMVDVSKVVGQPIRVDEKNILIPVSKVVFGFGAGGSEFSTKQSGKAFNMELSDELYPFGGGSGGGINISPVAFLKITDGEMKIMTVEKNPTITEKLLELAKEYLVNKND